MRQARKTTRSARGTTRAKASTDAGRNPLRPRKVPHQARAAATVGAILEAAADILETKGFDAYTTNAVAERAGASIGSLYQYFPNKTALTQALIAREDASLLSELTKLLERAKGIELLHQLIRIAVEQQLRRPVLARLLDAEEARLPPTDETRQLHDMLTSIFRRCLGNQLIAREPYIPGDLFSIIHGMVDAASQNGESDGQALARRIERAVCGYVDSFEVGQRPAAKPSLRLDAHR